MKADRPSQRPSVGAATASSPDRRSSPRLPVDPGPDKTKRQWLEQWLETEEEAFNLPFTD